MLINGTYIFKEEGDVVYTPRDGEPLLCYCIYIFILNLIESF